MVGFSEEETLEIRAASIPDEKLRALTQLTREITLQRGRPDDQYVEQFFQVGYSKQALVELVAYVGFMTFSNYLNNLTEVPIDFPKAKALKKAA
jgi:alkylhydroperoxidase family enzyme